MNKEGWYFMGLNYASNVSVGNSVKIERVCMQHKHPYSRGAINRPPSINNREKAPTLIQQASDITFKNASYTANETWGVKNEVPTTMIPNIGIPIGSWVYLGNKDS